MNPPGRYASLRVDGSSRIWRNATPTGIVTLLVEQVGFPWANISRVYPVKSGFCIKVSKSFLRELLARKIKEHGYTIELEMLTFVYPFKNYPKYIMAYDGTRQFTDVLIAEEAVTVTKECGCP